MRNILSGIPVLLLSLLLSVPALAVEGDTPVPVTPEPVVQDLSWKERAFEFGGKVLGAANDKIVKPAAAGTKRIFSKDERHKRLVQQKTDMHIQLLDERELNGELNAELASLRSELDMAKITEPHPDEFLREQVNTFCGQLME